MLTNAIMVLLLGVFAAIVAFLVNKRNSDSPSVPRNSLPIQIDRSDFENPKTEWILILFSSDSCDSCQEVRNLIKGLTLDSFHIQEVEFPQETPTHQRYGIDSVPITLVAGTDGVVVWSYAGVPTADLLSNMVSSL
ncbi:MAG: hypothetical protein VYB80_03135 [Actinomycetota bacterium]|nr:hypothetical protein [Actinomycetota bacterium]